MVEDKKSEQKKFELSTEERAKLIKLFKDLENQRNHSAIYIIGRLLKFAEIVL